MATNAQKNNSTSGPKPYPRVDKHNGKITPPRIEIETQNLPSELADIPRFVCWKWEWRKNKWTKPPYNARTGEYAKADDRATYTTYSEAMAAYRRDKSYAGIGFVFTDDDDLMGVDVDGCINADGSLTETGLTAVKNFGDSYCEVSPSALGLKFLIRAKLPGEKSGRKNPKLDVEAYQSGRYFTVTGRLWPGSQKAMLQKQQDFDQWFNLVFPTAKTADKTDKTQPEPVSAGVAEIVDKAMAASNGHKFQKLWQGDCSEFSDDQSSADLALCSMLAFWCGGNASLIDQCFRASGLMRDKWEREDYRTGTIEKAVAGCREFYDWNRQSGSFDSSVSDSDTAETKTAESKPWPSLIPISGPEPVEMSVDDFPPCVSGMVQSIVDMAEVPVELPGLMALGVLATACQKKYQIASDGSHREPLNLYLCAAMPPGERKTAVVSVLTGPLRRWEQQKRAELAPEIKMAESARKTAEKRIEFLRSRASKSEDANDRADVQREIDAIERELPVVPHRPLLTTDDCTVEHVATLLSHQNERLSIVSDEGGIFDIMAGRYSAGKPNLDVYLQGHAGSPVRVNRGSREPVDLLSPALTMAVSCQPFVLEQMSDNRAFHGRGLLARFLISVPKSKLGYRSLCGKEIPQATIDQWHLLVCRMLDMVQALDEFENPVSQTIYLNPDAYRIWKAEQHATEIDMRPSGAWASNTGWASKYPGAVLRIAGVLHCAICAEASQDPSAVDLPLSTMRFAVTLGQKIKSHCLHAFGLMALTDDMKFALKIIQWLRRDGIREFTGRECSVHCNSAGSVKELDGAFEILSERGWIRQTVRKPDGGGRPSYPFEVNPAVANFDDKTDKTQQPDEKSHSDDANSDDKTDKTGHQADSDGVSSVLSSVSGNPVSRPEIQEPPDPDDYDFTFGSDPVDGGAI